MKNYILTVAAMLMAATSMAQNSGSVNIESVTPTAEQDKLIYISPDDDIENENDRTQKIVTDIEYINGVNFTHIMQHFLVECVASQADFSKGKTENVYLPEGVVKAISVMPAGAKVKGLALPGYYTGGPSNFVKSMYSYLFIKNLNDEPTINPPYKDITYGNLTRETAVSSYQKLYFYNPEYNYLQAIAKSDHQLRAIDSQGEDHPYVLDMTFDKPFQYDGGYIHLALELTPANDAGVESQANNAYATRFCFPRTISSFEKATIYHSYRKGGHFDTEFNFYQGAENNLKSQLRFAAMIGGYDIDVDDIADRIFNYFNFQDYTLPAFQLTYYTNDIRGTVKDPVTHEPINEVGNYDTNLQPNGRPLIRLYDETDKKYIKPDGVTSLNSLCGAEVNEDGSFCFSNLDHTHVYTLSAASYTCGYQEKTINFDTGSAQAKDFNIDNAIKNDLECEIYMKIGVVTAITDVAASSSPVAVDYYNVAGVRSATPFKGVNIIVKTYSDGSRTTKKMIK